MKDRSLKDRCRYTSVSEYETVCEWELASGTRLTRAERQALTRAALLEAGAEVFVRRGYEAATVEEISEVAGYTRGGFYSNFESKDELFLTLIESRTLGTLADIQAAFAEGGSPLERLSRGGRFLDSLASERRDWCLLYMEFWSRAVRDPKLRRRFAGQYKAWRDGIVAMIEAQYESLGITPDASSEETASSLIALFEGQVLQRLIDPKPFSAGFFERLLLRFFARLGVVSE